MIFAKRQGIAMQSEHQISDDAKSVLKALATRKNVIVAGPPGTGKSRLLNEVREAFQWKDSSTGSAPYAAVPIPAATAPIPSWFPSPDRTRSRRVFPTVFDQNTKYRDFMRGLVPKVGQAGAFEVTEGTMYRASMHAVKHGNAALVIVDEINRGPAVAAFGSALVGLEADKRLRSDGTDSITTQHFEILGDQGQSEQFALPADLYVLAAMNEADTSVEPLDVAFLRRFHQYRLEPDVDVLRTHLGLDPEQVENSASLPAVASTPWDYYEALAQGFKKINEQIELGRGQAYQLGHGALMQREVGISNIGASREYIAEAWSTLRAHVDEIFYGNTQAVSDVLRAESPNSPYWLRVETFAGQTVRRIVGPLRPEPDQLYALLRTIATE